MSSFVIARRFWDGNSPFVTKLKKALHRQEQQIREVWVRIDTDGGETLDQAELNEMSSILGIKLHELEVEFAVEEMGGYDHGGNDVEIPYDNFVAWWLSDSKIAAKVRAAKKSDDGIAHHMFTVLLDKGQLAVTAQNLMQKSKQVFGEVLSHGASIDLLREINEDSDKGDRHDIDSKELEEWWRSAKPLAIKFRELRQVDVATIKGILAEFDEDKGSGKSDNRLDEFELAKMIKKMKFKITKESSKVVTDIVAEVKVLAKELFSLRIEQAWELNSKQAELQAVMDGTNADGIGTSDTDNAAGAVHSEKFDHVRLALVIESLGYKPRVEGVADIMQCQDITVRVEERPERITFSQLKTFLETPRTLDYTRKKILRAMTANVHLHPNFMEFEVWLAHLQVDDS